LYLYEEGNVMKKVIISLLFASSLCVAGQICKVRPSGELDCADTTHTPEPGDCYQKIVAVSGGGSTPMTCSELHDLLNTAADSAYFMFDIEISVIVSPQSMYDSVQMARLSQIAQEMFVKYDIRYLDTVTKVIWPLNREGYEVDYFYPYLVMTKSTALELKDEAYIASLGYRDKLPSVSLPSQRGRSLSPKGGQGLFDVLGKPRARRHDRGRVLFPRDAR
jgi:hypothetical protein